MQTLADDNEEVGRPSEGATEVEEDKFEDLLKEIEKLGRQKDKSVWKLILKCPKEVRPAMRLACSLPSTQVSVERSFSQLKLLLRDNRAKMGSDLADALLFLRANKCV